MRRSINLSFLRFLIFLVMITISFSCANIRPIQGGPEDKEVPFYETQLSSVNEQTNFNGRTLQFVFNEWVNLNNPSQNIFLVPSTKYPLITKLKGKKLVVTLDSRDTLFQNTTYTLMMNNAVKDITNNNITENLSYVFSTGDYIDSLSVSGTVIDAYSLKPVAKSIVAIYLNTQESSIRTSRPDYYTIADNKGKFIIKNLKSNSYSVYALTDKNQNNYYDQKTEMIGFLKHPLVIAEDNIKDIQLKLSLEKGKMIAKDKKNLNGLFKLIFNNIINNIEVNCTTCEEIQEIHENDSLQIWYKTKDTSLLIVKANESIDSFWINPTRWESVFPKYRVSRYSEQLFPNHPIELSFGEPIQSFDTSKISFTQELKYSIIKDSLDSRKLFINPKGNLSKNLRLILKDSAIIGIHNSWNTNDTLSIKLIEPATVAKLKIKLDSLKIGQTYILQLVSGEKIIDERNFISKFREHEIQYNNLVPGKYDLKIIEDMNQNKIWDPCQLDTRILAEEVFIFKLKELRADWDLEMNIKMQ
ncbi:MAG: Ig-like domain-containing protein [Saprospiraceae bacterium]|nr:Ig-like domain-containing protein [Saprospiraceae bacterium]